MRAAAAAANRLIEKIEEIIADHLQPGREVDEKAAFYQIVTTIEDSREIAIVRMALDDDPVRFGEPTPLAAGDRTG
ncbi:hypothetical protein [Phenylobacterium sp.]|uniref:hypothetical protein n=1 Tax=Phenylobacterium sp. TaxID=1871053 RepID=UPI002DF32714|nr:hypothetical protein [Phenylobacterium sp.]